MLFLFLFLGVGWHSRHGFEICRWELVKGRWRTIHTWSASAVALVVSVGRAPSARCLDKRMRGLRLRHRILLGLMTCRQAFSDVDPFPLMPASRWAANRALSAAGSWGMVGRFRLCRKCPQSQLFGLCVPLQCQIQRERLHLRVWQNPNLGSDFQWSLNLELSRMRWGGEPKQCNDLGHRTRSRMVKREWECR